ncbi:MAG: ABC transporter ATP-binding protein [Thomasclavelia sp.]
MEVKQIKFSYQNKPLIDNLSISFKQNKITSIIGPNGSGKSTLLMLLSRIYKISAGDIYLDGKNIWDYKIKEFAKMVAVVHQKNQIYGDLNVKTIVGYGRLPYLNYHQNLSEEDYQIIDWALKITNLKKYQDHQIANLSGGQQQRVWIAMALAQKTPILLLDEPTTYLDVKYQIEILNLIKQINNDYQMTIIMVHHDINQAINYSDEIVAMKNGAILFQGKPQEVISSSSLQKLYDYDLQVIDHDHQKIVLNYQ